MLLSIFLAACCLGIARAAETFAYHFGGTPFEEREVARSPVAKGVPAPTPFVSAGDELRDVTGIFRERRIPLKDGWAIWNKTRRLLVVRGGTVDQWRVEQSTGFLDQELLVRIIVDWTRAGQEDGAVVDQAAVFASVASVSKSGMHVTSSGGQSDAMVDWTLSVEIEPNVGAWGAIDCQFVIGWKGPGGEGTGRGSIETALALRDGGRQPLASWSAAGRGPASTMTVKSDILLADGTLWREARCRQVGEHFVRWNLASEVSLSSNRSEFSGFPNQTDRQVKAMKLGRNLVHEVTQAVPSNSDPFAEPPANRPVPPLDLRDAQIPPDLSDIFDRPMLDFRPVFGKWGISLHEGDFAAYDPISGFLFVVCDRNEPIHQFESIVLTSDGGPARNTEIAAWLMNAATPESLLSKLTIHGRLGRGAKMEWYSSKNQPIALFEVNTTSGETSEEVNIQYDWVAPLPGNTPESRWHSQSKFTLSNGIPFMTDASQLPDGTKVQQGLRATVPPSIPESSD